MRLDVSAARDPADEPTRSYVSPRSRRNTSTSTPATGTSRALTSTTQSKRIKGPTSSLLDRLQRPTLQSSQFPVHLTGEAGTKASLRKKQADRDRRAETARKMAREKAARKSAQLWKALETRSATRLQSVYRGMKGRDKAYDYEQAHPGLREARPKTWRLVPPRRTGGE